MYDRTELRATALHMAAFNGDLELIQLFHENGANMLVRTSSGVTALHMAAQGNQAGSLNALLYHYDGFDVNQTDASGATPLIWAAFCGSEVSLTYLLAQPGIKVNQQNEKGETALHLAIASGNIQKPQNLIKRLMIKGADIKMPDRKGRTPLETAQKRYKKENADMGETLAVLDRADEEKKSCWVKFKELLMIT